MAVGVLSVEWLSLCSQVVEIHFVEVPEVRYLRQRQNDDSIWCCGTLELCRTGTL